MKADFFNFNTAMTGEELETLKATATRALDSGSAEMAFRQEMGKFGLIYEGNIPGDGSLVRIQAPKDKGHDKSAWFVFYADGVPSGCFGNWRTGEKYTWCARSRSEMSSAEIEAEKQRRDAAKEKREAFREEEAMVARKKLLLQWQKATEVHEHSYLRKKNVPSHGLRRLNDNLLIPMFDPNGDILSAQIIFPDGNKKFFPGLPTAGALFTIEGTGPVCLCEGYATGATIHAVTGWNIVICFTAANLTTVSKALKQKKPDYEYVVAADNDQWGTKPDGTPHNIGVIKAEEAAAILGGRLYIPEFTDESIASGQKPTDFNDMVALEGIKTVRDQLVGISDGGDDEIAKIRAGSVDFFDKGPLPEREWLVNDLIQVGQPGLFAAMGDAGKGMLMLDLGLKVAKEKGPAEIFKFPVFFGHGVCKTGRVLYVTAEDTQDEIRRRLDGIDPSGARFEDGSAERFHILCMPDLGGTRAYFKRIDNEPAVTQRFLNLKEALKTFDDWALIIIDPLASFVASDVNQDPADGSFVTGQLAALSKEINATVVVVHHMNKGHKEGIRSALEARQAIRGTTALVDGVRFAICLWEETLKDYAAAKNICKTLGTEWGPGRVFHGAIVKSNGPADKQIKTFLRNMGNGLLEDRTHDIQTKKVEAKEVRKWEIGELAEVLLHDISWFASQGHAVKTDHFEGKKLRRLRPLLSPPFDTLLDGEGENRVYAIRANEISESLKMLMTDERIVEAKGGYAAGSFLDVPGGIYATYDPETSDDPPHKKGGARARRS